MAHLPSQRCQEVEKWVLGSRKTGSIYSEGRCDNSEQMASLWGILNRVQSLENSGRFSGYAATSPGGLCHGLRLQGSKQVLLHRASPAMSQHDNCGCTSAMPPSCYEDRAVPRKLRPFAAAQSRLLAHGCAQGTSFSSAVCGDGWRAQRGSPGGAGTGVSSGEQQPPAGKIAMEELSQANSSSFQKKNKTTQHPKPTGSPEYFPAHFFPAATTPGNCACSGASAEH